MNEGAVLFEPGAATFAVILDGDGFSGMEDDSHVLVEIWEIVDGLSVELLLIEQE